MKKRFLKKLKSNRGESLGETLAALVIIALGMTMLAGSIVSASNVNKKVRDYDTTFQITSPAPVSTPGVATITHSATAAAASTPNVNVYTTSPSADSGGGDSAPAASDSDVHYVYYEKVKPTPSPQPTANAG